MDPRSNTVRSKPTYGKKSAAVHVDRFTSLFDSMPQLLTAFVFPCDIIARCTLLSRRICHLSQRDTLWRHQLFQQTFNGISTSQSRLRMDTLAFPHGGLE
jgi:hypothetical protein